MKGFFGMAVASGVMALLAALILNGPILIICGLLAAATGIVAMLQKEPAGYAVGPLLIVLGLVAALASIGGVSSENSSFGSFEPETGQAFAVVAGSMAMLAFALLNWAEAEPSWQPIVVTVAAILASILAFALANQLGNPIAGGAWGAGLAVAAALGGTIWMRVTQV